MVVIVYLSIQREKQQQKMGKKWNDFGSSTKNEVAKHKMKIALFIALQIYSCTISRNWDGKREKK